MDHHQLAELAETHYATIWRYLRAAGADADLADDLVQETFLEVQRRPIEYRSAAEAVGYLRSVARHRLIDCRRRAGHRVGHAVPLDEVMDQLEAAWTEFVPDGESSDDRVAALRSCVRRLDAREHDAVRARYRDGQTVRQIASAWSETADAIGGLLKRTRARLRACIQRTLQGGPDR